MSDIELMQEVEIDQEDPFDHRPLRLPSRSNLPSTKEVSGEERRIPIRSGINPGFKTTAGVTRATRKPLRQTGVLVGVERPGFVRAWKNDVGDNIDRLIKNGYQYVTDATLRIGADDRITQPGSMASSFISRKDKNGVEVFYMEIPEEWYQENQQEKQKARANARRGMFEPDKNLGQYKPDASKFI
jgi:hypothetical protein